MNFLDLSYIIGLSTMFFGMMAVFFWDREELLRKLVSLLMAAIALGSIKDFVFLELGIYDSERYWPVMTALDMVTVPLYAFVLVELVSPGRITRRVMILQETPFVILTVAYLIFRVDWVFYVLIGWAGIYGNYYLVHTAMMIPRYNRQLKEQYSYTENINLNWLRTILYIFYLILALWILDCLVFKTFVECIYMLGNLLLWIVISFFLFRHESVIDELTAVGEPSAYNMELKPNDTLAARIEKAFESEHLFLNPNLKLSDLAKAVGSNRTYLSNYFNRIAGTTFYDYVNSLRVKYASQLLCDSNLSIKQIAAQSGFNSSTSFIRVFSKITGVTPSVFRDKDCPQD